MNKKNIIKILLVAIAVVGLVYLVVDQFNKVGTSEGHIDSYDLFGEINNGINSLSESWEKSSYNDFRVILSDIDISSGMRGLGESQSEQARSLVSEVFKSASSSYFKRSIWAEGDLSQINHIAGYLHDEEITGIIDGYYGAKRVIANSKSCSNQSTVDNCISAANSYNRSPWTNCSEIKNGIASVRNNALDSYTSRCLIPICNRLADYKNNYVYFDDFDRDYEKVKDGKIFLENHSYSNSSFISKFNAIKYNDAANVLDPRF